MHKNENVLVHLDVLAHLHVHVFEHLHVGEYLHAHMCTRRCKHENVQNTQLDAHTDTDKDTDFSMNMNKKIIASSLHSYG